MTATGADGGAPGRPASAATPSDRYWRAAAAGFLSVSLVVVIAGVLVYHAARTSVTHAVNHNLEAIAHLKAAHLDHWLDENRYEIRSALSSALAEPEFAGAFQQWLQGGRRDAGLEAGLLDHLRQIKSAHRYLEINLRSGQDGSLLLASGRLVDKVATRDLALASIRSGQTLLEDFHLEDSGGVPKMQIGFFQPVRIGGHTGVVAEVTLDASDVLFPTVLQWPGWNIPDKTRLLRREGDRVVVLGHPDAGRAASLGFSSAVLAGSAYADAMAVGAGKLPDGEAHPLFAYALPIPHTPWTLVTEVRQADAYAKLTTITRMTAAMVALILLSTGWWLLQQGRIAMARRRHDAEREAHLQLLNRLACRLVHVQEEERRHLSGELHDQVGANLATINLNLRSIGRMLPAPDPQRLESMLTETRALLADTIASIRDYCADLRPAVLDYSGLVPALDDLVQRFGRRSDIVARFRQQNMLDRLPPQTESMLYRIAQEALTNCAKHSEATAVEVAIGREADRTVVLTVSDDGKGFDPDHPAASRVGMGLLTMRERAAMAGGELSLRSSPGGGTQVRVTVRGDAVAGEAVAHASAASASASLRPAAL